MLQTLLDPRKSQFISEASYFSPYGSAFKARLFDTDWYFTQTGEPHLVTFNRLHPIELAQQGKVLNTHYRCIFPRGISLNSVIVLDSKTLSVTTYERGVLRITQSCGSGSTSAAVLASKLGLLSSAPFFVQTSGGMLEISLSSNSSFLIGPACIEASQSFIEMEYTHE